LFVCALCEIGRQQAMGGQGCYKHSMERKSWMLHDEYNNRSSRTKESRFVGFVESIVQCIEWGTCKDW
jgi:hypothetical protein